MPWTKQTVKIEVPKEWISSIEPAINDLKTNVLDPLVGETYDPNNPTVFPGGIFSTVFNILDALPAGIDTSTNVIMPLVQGFLDNLETLYFDISNTSISTFILTPYSKGVNEPIISIPLQREVEGITNADNTTIQLKTLPTSKAIQLLKESFDDEFDLSRPLLSENGQYYFFGILYSINISTQEEIDKIQEISNILSSLLNFVDLPEFEKAKRKLDEEYAKIEETQETEGVSTLPDWYGISINNLFPFMKDINDFFKEMTETCQSYITATETAIDALKKTIAFKIATLYKFVKSTSELIQQFQTIGELTDVYVIQAQGTGLSSLKSDLQNIPSSILSNNMTFMWIVGGNTTQFKEIENLIGIVKQVTEMPIKVDAIITDKDTGSYFNPIEVDIMCITKDASIYYTLDGGDPFWNPSRILYTGTPISIVNENTTLKAVGVKSGLINSDTFIFNYNYKVAPLTYYIVEEDNAVVRRIYVECETDSVQIRYTLDGSNVTETSPLYSSYIGIEYYSQVRIKGFKVGYTFSDQLEFTMVPKVAPIHYFDETTDIEILQGDTFTESILVRLDCETNDALIFYTLDGTSPVIELDETGSYISGNDATIFYDEPFVIAKNIFINKKIYAIGARPAFDASDVTYREIQFTNA
jgi:hypothetical protein